MDHQALIRKTLAAGDGVFRLNPVFVPRQFGKAGRRLKLHPDDYYALGIERGSIKERWFSSVIPAQNGPLAAPDEGMSYVAVSPDTDEKFTLKEAVDVLGAELIGSELIEKYGGWPMYSKFFDFLNPLFHHVHLMFEHAAKVGKLGKPESYYFPPQLNNHTGEMNATYFGFDPDVDPEEVKQRLRDYLKGDTRITELSRAYRVALGTGWYTPAGVIHAPASVLTYEPQWNSDVNTIMENVTMGEVNNENMLTGCQPEGEKGDVEKLFEQIDWAESTRPNYKEKYFRAPKPLPETQRGLSEKWVAYANEWIAAKEVTVAPGAEVTLTDEACYCALVVQGYGSFGEFACEAPGVLRFGQLSGDEFFVAESAAKGGIVIRNTGAYEPLVILQNFANNNPAVPETV